MITRPTSVDGSSDETSSFPLAVDLDHTLIRTDILWESVVQLWRHPLVALGAVLALVFRGKAAFKTVLARAIAIDVTRLPYHQEVLEFARSQHTSGREVILATATHRIIADDVARHLGIFSGVLATESDSNLSGVNKLARLESNFGKNGFDYIGDHQKDLPIFKAARQSMLVDPSVELLRKASSAANVSRIFTSDRLNAKGIVRALRIHQWAKNALLAVPLLTAHKALNLEAWVDCLAAFIAFGFVASATYLINDLVDLNSDRVHAHKKFRPLASGLMTIPQGLLLSLSLGLAGFAISIALLPSEFVAYLLFYVTLTLAYSLDLKRRLLVDVLALAILYTLRILAGGAAIGVAVSEWLLMFSLFMFFSLAFLKRVIEIRGSTGVARISGRGYVSSDLETMRIVGIASGLMSALVLSLYIDSSAVTLLYTSPQILWLMCPLLIYWIARIWFLAGRDEIHHDPVVFALLDWRSYAVGASALVIAVVAKLGPAAFQL